MSDLKLSRFFTLQELLRYSFGYIYLHFGFLKFFPGLSSAEQLSVETIGKLSFSLIDPSAAILILSILECFIGLGFLLRLNRFQWFKYVFIFHMLGTFTPLVLLISDTFREFPFVPTLKGQYIIKNLILLFAGLSLFSKEKP